MWIGFCKSIPRIRSTTPGTCVTQSDKPWAQRYPAIRNLIVHTIIDEDNWTTANFDRAILSLDSDDTILRASVEARRPNDRPWRLECKADCELWFHTEISNVVLAAWNQYPRVMQSPNLPWPVRRDMIGVGSALTGEATANQPQNRQIPLVTLLLFSRRS